MKSSLIVAGALVFSVVLVAIALRRLQGQSESQARVIRSALRLAIGPFPLSIAIHLFVLLLLIVTVHESRGRELIMVNLEAGGGGGGGGDEMENLDIPEVPMPESAPVTAEQPISADVQNTVASAESFVSEANGIGIGSGTGIGSGRGHGIGPGFGGFIETLRRTGLDVVLVIDGTGSMHLVIDEVKARMNALITTLHRLVPIARVGVVVYGGKGERIETQPLTLSPPRLEAFLNGIEAKGGGEWQENVLGGIDTAIDKMDWKPYARKVIVLIADSPPPKADFPRLIQLLHQFRAENGTFNAIDLAELEHRRFEQEFEKTVHGGGGEKSNDAAPLPAFYRETQMSYQFAAREGGGEVRSLESNGQINQEVMTLVFGSRWRETVATFAHR
jgi:von Willebrand factor type A domain